MAFGNSDARFFGAGRKSRELRRFRRRTVGSPGWIKLDGGFARRSCQVLDISETGVRLLADQTVPDIFGFISALGGSYRRARVKWRRSDQIGAEFF